jgi:hypothetical protein
LKVESIQVVSKIQVGVEARPPLKKKPGQGESVQELGKMAGELKKELVDPLRSSLTLSAAESVQLKGGSFQTRSQIESVASQSLSPGLKEFTRSLGVTGGALGGVAGLNEVVTGLRDGDAPKALSGAADVAASASALASLGMIGGAAVLGPASTVLIGMRGLQRSQKDDRASHLSATTDLLTAGMFCAKMLPVTAAVPIGLGLMATTVGLFRGLHSLKKGVETNDQRLRTQGTGETLTALGVTLVSTGVAVAPGIGLMLGGLALPLLQRTRPGRKVVNKAVDWTAQKLYPMSFHSEAFLDKAAPVLQPVQAAYRKGKTLAEPVTKPLKKLGEKAFQVAQEGTRWLMGSWVMNLVEKPVSQVNKVLSALKDVPPEGKTETPATSTNLRPRAPTSHPSAK